jgi:hypothetical protein
VLKCTYHSRVEGRRAGKLSGRWGVKFRDRYLLSPWHDEDGGYCSYTQSEKEIDYYENLWRLKDEGD